jgi:hypothetical protein
MSLGIHKGKARREVCSLHFQRSKNNLYKEQKLAMGKMKHEMEKNNGGTTQSNAKSMS